jgi:sec-independent protein translocase protein TatC
MNFSDRNASSEDLFADTRMSFGEHLEDLRAHLIRAILGFVVAMLISFIPGWSVLKFISRPVEEELQRFYDERAERVKKDLQEGVSSVEEVNKGRETVVQLSAAELTALGIQLPEGASDNGWVTVKMRIQPVNFYLALAKAQQLVYRRPGLSTLGPMEAFMAYIKVCFVCGLVLGSPWIFYQIWSFVAAGLYPHEKRLVNVYLPVSLLLFLIGATFCQFFVVPRALQALLWFNHWLDLEPDLRFNEWLGFAILLPVIFGISFQLPLLMMFLERIGVLSVQMYVAKWRIAVFVIHAFAAVITPVDIFSMESLALTMCGLYFLGILLCKLVPTKGRPGVDVPDEGEMVEV